MPASSRIGDLFRAIILLPVLLSVIHSQAQHGQVQIFGQVRDQDTKEFIAEGTVVAVDRLDGSFSITSAIDTAGEFSMFLPYDRSYKVEFSATDHVPRHVLVDLSGIAKSDRRAGYDLRIDPVLFRRLSDRNYALFEEEPAGICLYDQEQKTLVWDMAYILSTKQLIKESLEQDQ